MMARVPLVLSVVAAAPAAAQLSFQPLGFAPGRPSSRAQAISADGGTIVGDEEASLSSRAWYWRPATGMTLIGGTRARSVSPDGDVIVGLQGGTGGTSFRYRVSTNTNFVLPFLGGYGLEAFGASADGTTIVGKVWAVHSDFPQIWREGQGFSGLPYAPNTDSGYAYATTPDGSVVVGDMYAFVNSSGTAFRWTSAGTVALGTLTGGQGRSGALAVSPDGSVIVGYSSSATFRSPFRWVQGQGMQELGMPAGATDGRALALNPDGSVVAGFYWANNADHAFIWDQAHGTRDLQLVLEQQGSSGELLQWSLQRATGVSADGRSIAGYGIDPQGRTQAFLARIGLPCYANCDASTTPPVLNVLDFNCFINRFIAGDSWANCDDSTGPPILNVVDFMCFLARFTEGC
jgi:uncharacterized membrane protein